MPAASENKHYEALSLTFQSDGRGEQGREVRWRRCTAAFVEGRGNWEANRSFWLSLLPLKVLSNPLLSFAVLIVTLEIKAVVL